MKIDRFPDDIKDHLLPFHTDAQMAYECIGCEAHYPLDRFLYTCPSCGGLLRICRPHLRCPQGDPGVPVARESSIIAGCSTSTG